MTFKIGTTFTDALEVKPLDAENPRVRFEVELQGSGAVGATAATTAAGFFLCRVVTTAGTTVAARIPFFNV